MTRFVVYMRFISWIHPLGCYSLRWNLTSTLPLSHHIYPGWDDVGRGKAEGRVLHWNSRLPVSLVGRRGGGEEMGGLVYRTM
jgi:hypothetical protein